MPVCRLPGWGLQQIFEVLKVGPYVSSVVNSALWATSQREEEASLRRELFGMHDRLGGPHGTNGTVGSAAEELWALWKDGVVKECGKNCNRKNGKREKPWRQHWDAVPARVHTRSCKLPAASRSMFRASCPFESRGIAGGLSLYLDTRGSWDAFKGRGI